MYVKLPLLSLAAFIISFTMPLVAQNSQSISAHKGEGTPLPKVEILTTGHKTSIRGLSVVNDQVIWVSGSGGQVGRSVDSGKTWQWITVPGYEKRDFRDIEAFDSLKAVIMAVAEPANILKTIDGGKTWKMVYENTTSGMFLDAMEFWNHDSGIVLGDPINGKFFIARSFDGGDSWHEIPGMELPKADTGEACFASSGTNIRKLDRREACFVSGGSRSRIFIRDQTIDLPLLQGQTSTGANSVAIMDNTTKKSGQFIIVVGGDFSHDTLRQGNCTISHDGGKTWISPAVAPHGYRSCVEFIGKDQVLTCGTSGVDISSDGGMNWQLIATDGFHVCRKAKKGKAVYLAGGGGRIAKLQSN